MSIKPEDHPLLGNGSDAATANLQARILQVMPDCAAVLTAGGEVLYINDSGVRMTGRETDGDLIGTNFADLWRVEERAKVRAALNEAAAGATTRMDGFIQTADGARWWDLTMAPLGVEAVGEPAIVVIARDVSERHEAQLRQRECELERAEQNALHREIVDSAIDTALISTDQNGRIVIWSEGARQITGWTPEEMIGEPLQRIFTPEDRAAGRAERELFVARETGRASDMRWHLKKDGSRFFAHGSITPLHGPARGYVKSFRDATLQHETETAFKKSHERYERTLENAQIIGTWDWDLVSKKLQADARFARLFSLDESLPDGVPVENLHDAVHPDDRARVAAVIAEALRSAEPFACECRIPLGGEIIQIVLRGQSEHDERGNATRLSGVSVDVTDKKRIESVLRESQSRLRNAIALASLGTVDWDAQTLETFLSERAREIFGLERNGADATSSILALIHPEDRAALTAQLEQAAESGEPVVSEYRIVTPDGTTRYLRSVGELVPGERPRLVGVVEDLTELRLATQRLQQMKETLEQRVKARTEKSRESDLRVRQSQKMEAIGQLTGGIAHDFNNLLAGVMGALEVIQSKVAQGRTGDLQRFIASAQGAANRAAVLTHRLLSFSRLQTLSPVLTDANRVLLAMEPLIRRTMGPRIQVQVQVSSKAGLVLADRNQLENSVLNLCINADDAMPDGGTLGVTTSSHRLEPDAAAEWELNPGEYVLISIEDTGRGMTPEVLARALDPFFTTKPSGSGTGLGLSMIYGFAKQSGGHVRIESQPGQGSRASLYLPRHVGEPRPVGRLEVQGTPRAAAGETVLVVEDEAAVRLLIVETLQEMGYSPVEAQDGTVALAILRSQRKIDLMVTDVGLPGGINGRQLAALAREARTDLKVLFITGYADHAVLNHEHLQSGMQIMIKPFPMEELVRTVEAMIFASR